jgi:hypothetical protein
MAEFSEYDIDERLDLPMRMICQGVSSSGKSSFAFKLLKHRAEMMTPCPQRIVWLYSQDQPLYREVKKAIPNVEFIEGLPDNLDGDFFDREVVNFCIIDDLMTECAGNKSVTKLFCQTSHHKNVSLMYLIQNGFYRGSEMRTINLNASHLVIFANPRDKSSITSLAKQVAPGNNAFIRDAYNQAVEATPFGYLCLSFHPRCPELLRVRTSIFPGEVTQVFIKK